MDTTNQIFNWKRFTAALRKEWVENRTVLLLVIAVTFLLYAVIPPTHIFTRGEMIYYFLINYGFVALACIVPSLANRQLKSKTGRIELLTLPTSIVEKFAVGITIYVIGFFVAFVICVQLADLLRSAISGFEMVPNHLFKCMDELHDFSHYVYNKPQYFEWTALVSTAPLFFLGTVLWPRWSVIKTFALTMAGTIILQFMFIGVKAMMGEHLDFDTIDNNAQYIVMTDVVNIVILIVSLVLAWYLLKRKDIVSLKWWK